ncbi:hypothetical protein SADUNF_Sadunf01G0162700 [Salix dunnii]|uniref:A-kinase anchor protein 7-like phosphoesterase domain-containing protein n=1 Tax=Salix dunnii TaxID=1413687 RepID=A0A835NCP0_9ROSI|nr:hypothetical protein SADUNF_Sadunf01G0162700 [Salix dunnii]
MYLAKFLLDKLTGDAALDPSGLVAIAVCHGFALFVAVAVGANISGGHVNPAVTFGLALGGQITILTGIFYWIAQLLGSIVACYVLKAVTGGLRISGVGKDSARMDRNKKLKSAVGIRQRQWRPVSVSASNTQGSANELDGDTIKVAQVVTDNCDSTISAGVLDDTVKPIHSSEKHSPSLEAIESSLDYSHFVCLPLAMHPELIDKLVNFQNSILGNNDVSADENLESDSIEDTLGIQNKDFGIDKSIFIKPTTLHLTVLMLKLWNKERVNAASGVLKSISSKVIDALDNQPIFIRLKGLDTMKGSVSRARVVYAPVEEIGSEGRLLQVIINAFVEAGLVLEKDAKQKLKLHATVMNARHRKGSGRSKNDSFDARGIFKQFGSEDWGEYLICEAHLSKRFVYDENGFYHCCASIPFPGKEERKHTD